LENNIADAFNKGNSAEELLKIIGFLTEYTIVHFATEEELQIKYNYPGYKAHKQSHEDFKVTVGELTQRFLTEEPGKELVQDVTMTIGDWLISHIRVDDIRMAKFIKDNE